MLQLLLNDEQLTSSQTMLTYRDILSFKTKYTNQIEEKLLYSILDEVVYKLATSELSELGESVFQLLNTMCQADSGISKLIVRRYKNVRILIRKWQEKLGDEKNIDLMGFLDQFNRANRTRLTDQELHNKAIVIQAHWRGYAMRKRLRKANQAFAKLQQEYRQKKAEQEMQKQKQLAEEELKFQLLLRHRREQRERKVQLMQIIEILPLNQIEAYFERQREYSAKLIQSAYRGYRKRKAFAQQKDHLIRAKAAILIQQSVIFFYDFII